MREKEKKIIKEYLYTTSADGFYQWKVYKITDGIGQVYYVAHPVGHGISALADKLEDIQPQLEKQVPILNDFLSKVDRRIHR